MFIYKEVSMTLAIRKACFYVGEKYLSCAEKVSNGPFVETAPFASSATIGAIIAVVAKALGRTTTFWPLFQTIFTICSVTHSALLSPVQPSPEKRNRWQSLIKSVVHTSWSLRAGVTNALLFDFFKRVGYLGLVYSGHPLFYYKYFLGFWDFVSIVTILPPFATPLCGLKAGMMIVGGVAAVSFASKWTSNYFHKDDVGSKKLVSIRQTALLKSPRDLDEFDQRERYSFDRTTKKWYFTPPPLKDLDDALVDRYKVAGWGGLSLHYLRIVKQKNLKVDGHPLQLGDMISFIKEEEQIAFEEDEKKEKFSRKPICFTCFQRLDHFRTLFSWELVPFRRGASRRGEPIKELIRQQQELAAELDKDMKEKLDTCWKDRYSSYLICGEEELKEMGLSMAAKTRYVLMLFYKPLPEAPTT